MYSRKEEKKLLKELDKLWSLAIRKRDKYTCQKCGKKTKYVQAAHIFRRGNLATRFDKENGITLCSMCHIWSKHFSAHHTPVEFTEWIIKRLGTVRYNILKGRTKLQRRLDLQQIKEELTNEN